MQEFIGVNLDGITKNYLPLLNIFLLKLKKLQREKSKTSCDYLKNKGVD